MKPKHAFLLAALMASALAWRSLPRTDAQVSYPDGYRNWEHVKSTLISPAHSNFANTGGFQHVYANREAITGYRTRVFPEGSKIVVDWLDMKDVNGAFVEGPRRQVDVMVKDAKRFANTGGWGFQRFMKDSKTEHSTTLLSAQCFACHDSRKKDALVLSSYRP